MSTAAPAVAPTWTTGSTEVFKTGTWRAALPRHIHAPSPCHQACPVGGEIAAWIGHARARQWREAWQVLTRHNPFPAIAGRICHHPCEAACNRSGHDEALAICKLERFVGDFALAQGWAFEAPVAERPGHVAVVGGGPAGLSAAFQLRRRGWRVTIYEASDRLGGLMRHGIPSYRLAREVLDGEVDRIVALGVELRCNQALADPEAFAALRRQHDAVFVAVGAARVKRLPGLDYAKRSVIDGAAYLAAANAGRAPALGRRVAVIGGGSAALDAARSARRAGHEVTIVALESREQMPAQREEVVEAIEEGTRLVDGAMLTAAIARGDALALRCMKLIFEPGAERGQFSAAPVEGSEFTLEADAIITSIGQDPDLAPFGDGLATNGSLLAAGRDGDTAAPGVWAGGDVASLARFVTEAVGMGKRAALAIHRHLAGEADEAEAADEAVVSLAAIATWYHPHAARAAAPDLDAAERLAAGAEVQLGLALDQALAEAERCFSCGSCIACDNCVIYCPDLAVRHGAAGYEVNGDYCKGCGLCVRECPTGSMKMVEERR
jgi:NADPH-dependent glutamate synthase beta subunit-like oxidoreductase/Pyruvate/2-oxoacid:ferredoxin oxidoreductase delta subunit